MPTRKPVLITGGAGFIGAHLAQRLIHEGKKAIVLDHADFESSSLGKLGLINHPSLKCLSGSVLDETVWGELPTNIEYVVHAAAVLGIERVGLQQIETMDTTIHGTRECLKFAGQLRHLQRFVYLSTSEVYGADAGCSKEVDAAVIQTVGRRWCYAAAKLAGEFYVKAFAEKYHFPYSIIRPFNVYGPHRAGENAMTNIARLAIANEVIRVSGTGLQTRSWCYIDDFIEGLYRCMHFACGENRTFNLGNDQDEMSVLELAELIRTTANSLSEIIVDGNRGEDVETRSPDLKAVRHLLNYDPHVGIEDGVRRVIEWARAAAD